ncbi:MAG: alpha/beta hydrolase [Desulfosudaceae bacterium]
MASPELETLIRFLRQVQGQNDAPDPEKLRAGLEQMAAMIPADADISVKAESAGGVAAEWADAPGGATDRFLVYFHGGGYAGGSPQTHRDIIARLARATRRRVLGVDYRLAPENPFPAAVEDAVTACRWLLNEFGAPPERVAVAGDSAGGGLTLAMLVKLRDEGARLPAAAVCMSPWTDLAVTGDSVRKRAEIDPFLTPAGLRHFSDLYRQGADPASPLVSPLYADLSGLPPMLLQVGERECLLDDSVRLAEKARAAGVDVTLEIWDGMVHVFQGFAAVLPEGADAIRRVGDYLNDF